jgi:hypothetical protein
MPVGRSPMGALDIGPAAVPLVAGRWQAMAGRWVLGLGGPTVGGSRVWIRGDGAGVAMIRPG